MNNQLTPPAVIETVQTISIVETAIERNLVELANRKNTLKEYREELKNVHDNDSEYAQIEEEVEQVKKRLAERKAALAKSPQVTSLKLKIKEQAEEVKEVKEMLYNHIESYSKMTNSRQYETSDGQMLMFEPKYTIRRGSK